MVEEKGGRGESGFCEGGMKEGRKTVWERRVGREAWKGREGELGEC